MKNEIAKSCHLYSYMESLLDDYNSSVSKTSVVSKFLNVYMCNVNSKLQAYSMNIDKGT